MTEISPDSIEGLRRMWLSLFLDYPVLHTHSCLTSSPQVWSLTGCWSPGNHMDLYCSLCFIIHEPWWWNGDVASSFTYMKYLFLKTCSDFKNTLALRSNGHWSGYRFLSSGKEKKPRILLLFVLLFFFVNVYIHSTLRCYLIVTYSHVLSEIVKWKWGLVDREVMRQISLLWRKTNALGVQCPVYSI